MDVSELTQPEAPEEASAEALALQELIRPYCAVRTLVGGEVLWYQSDEADELAFVEAGELEVWVGDTCVSRVYSGAFLGEASAFGPMETRTATVRARDRVQVLICTNDRIRALRSEAPEVYDAVLDRALLTLIDRVRQVNTKVSRLAEGVIARPKREVPPLPEEVERFPGEAHAKQVVLRLLPSLVEADEAVIAALAEAFVSRTFEAGETVVLEGDHARSVFLLANGTVELVRNISTTKAIPMTTFGRGDLFGIHALLLGQARTASAIASTDCWLLELQHEAFERLDGEAGRVWREALAAAARVEIETANALLVAYEARREARIQRAYGVVKRALRPALSGAELEEVDATARAIFERLAKHRRLLPNSGDCAVQPCDACLGMHLEKLRRFVAAKRPVHMILPAYPAKSPNRDTKVLGTLPDMAEEQSLVYLQKVCDDVAEVYSPGARITICSDGRVFSDLVLVSDTLITTYGQEIDAMLERLGLASIDVFAIEDLFEVTTFEGMRDHLVTHYSDTYDTVRERAKAHAHHKSMYNGIHRFLFEDTLAVETDKSRSQIRKECGVRAYGVIQRSNAFSRLIAECFPHAVRLSIHPQPPHSAKFGILLGTASDAWITPWHGVALLDKDGYHLVKRAAAEERGAQLVERFGRPSHYELRHD